MRWTRPNRRASIGLAAGLAAFVATAVLALTQNGGAGSVALPLAPLSSAGHFRPAAALGPPGPEGMPIPEAPALALAARLTDGEQIDGIACQTGE